MPGAGGALDRLRRHDQSAGTGLRGYTWAAGISAATQKSGIISTSHVILNHPIIAAKQCAVIDHISNGRFTLNIVCGWNFPEMDMFGVPLQGHDDRYDCAEEWITIIKRLWSEDETFDFRASTTRSRRAICSRSRSRRRYPAIMNAGSSERGRHSRCKHCDLVYTVIRSPDPAVNKAHVQAYHKMAREEYGRDIGVWSARQYRAGRDRKGSARLLQLLCPREGRLGGGATTSSPPWRRRSTSATIRRSDVKAMAELFVAGWGGFPAGRHQGADRRRPDQAVEHGARRRAAVLSALRAGHARVPRRDLPLVKQAGLRDFL